MIALIPARGGSKRIPGKNKKDFHGKPIISYSIEAAQKAGIFDQIYVSTDDGEIQGIARSYGVDLTYRPARLADDEPGTEEVMSEFIKRTKIKDDEIMCCLYATAPTITPWNLLYAVQMLVINNASMVYSVDWDGEDAGQFYFAVAHTFKSFKVHGPNYIPGVVIKYTVDNAIDINTPADWDKATEIYSGMVG